MDAVSMGTCKSFNISLNICRFYTLDIVENFFVDGHYHIYHTLQCSKPCGEGSKSRKIICVNTKAAKEVRARYCKGKKMPEVEMKCKQDPCYMWQYGEWQPVKITIPLNDLAYV